MYNVYVGKLGQIVTELKSEYDVIIRDRERGRCFLCRARGNHVHEILSKSKFAINDIHECIAPHNMVLLCMEHHDMVQGDSGWSGYLLRALRDKYGYDYDRRPFDWYVEYEYPTEDQMRRYERH